MLESGGLVVGELLHRRGLRFTWALLAYTPAAALAVPFAVGALPAAARPFGTPSASASGLVLSAWPLSLVLVPVVATVWQLRRAGRDRLRGGEAERRLARQSRR